MPTYEYRCDAEHRFTAEHAMSAPALGACVWCGTPCRIVVRGRAAVKVPHRLRGDMREYRSDLAEFPGDPRAFVDGPRAVRRRIDEIKREGHEVRSIDDVRPTPPPSPALGRERFREIRARAEAAVARGDDRRDDHGGD